MNMAEAGRDDMGRLPPGDEPDPGSATVVISELATAAVGLAAHRRRAVLGVAGAPGSGKTTLTLALLAHIRELMGENWVAHVPMDGFHLADTQLRRLGALERKGAPDTFDAAGYAHLLHRIRTDTTHPIYVPGFERDLEQPIAAALVVEPSARLILTEGNYLLLDEPAWAQARAAMDAVWFVDSDQHTRVERLVARHIEFGKSPEGARAWVADVDERNAARIAATASGADRVVVNDGTW